MQLYVDLDGVLADFDKGYEVTFGHRPTDKDLNSPAHDKVKWDLVRSTKDFYRNLPPMEDFEILWKGVEQYNPIILTGVPRSVPEVLQNKLDWVIHHIGNRVKVIGCRSKEKSIYGKPGDILIDDWERYKYKWEGMGGIWITHTSAKNTLEKLSKYLK